MSTFGGFGLYRHGYVAVSITGLQLQFAPTRQDVGTEPESVPEALRRDQGIWSVDCPFTYKVRAKARTRLERSSNVISVSPPVRFTAD
jgi:hypothetical protein